MRHYRISTPNGWYTIDDERDMDAIGEIYKDRLVGETDAQGHLIDYYLSPETKKILAELANSPEFKKNTG